MAINPSSPRIGGRAHDIYVSLKARKLKKSQILSIIITLLENIDYQLRKYSKFRSCNLDLATVALQVSQLLIADVHSGDDKSGLVDEIKLTLRSKEVQVLSACQSQDTPGGDLILSRFEKLNSNKLKRVDALADSIESSTLNLLLQKQPDSVLVIDCRSHEEYIKVRLKHRSVINVPISSLQGLPENLASSSGGRILDANSLGSSVFNPESQFDTIVIYDLNYGVDLAAKNLHLLLDHNSNLAGLPANNPFSILIEALMSNHGHKLKNFPLYLVGGLNEWYRNFGSDALDFGYTSENVRSPDSNGHNVTLGRISSNNIYLRSFGEYFASGEIGGHEIIAVKHLKERGSAMEIPTPSRSSSTVSKEISTESSASFLGKGVKDDDKKQVYCEPESQILTGLDNLGNLCYMNCVVQCLSASEPLTKFLLRSRTCDGSSEAEFKKHINKGNVLGTNGIVTMALVDLLKSMEKHCNSHFAPRRFKTIIGENSPSRQFANFDQQDCIEFLNFILDGLHEDLNQRDSLSPADKKAVSELSIEQERAREHLPIRLAATIEWERYLKLNFSVIVDYFQGQYCSQLKCLECGNTSTSFNAFTTLSLPIPEIQHLHKLSTDLMSCLRSFTKTEQLDRENRWFCPSCRKHCDLTKKITVTRLPRILVIHLKRFSILPSGHFSKLDTLVNYPVEEIMDLTEFWPPIGTPISNDSTMDVMKEKSYLQEFPERMQIPPFKYKLYGVINHFGNLTTGHYTSYIRNASASTKWYYFDDAKFHMRKASEVLNKNAYCLFFWRE